jgi:tetratricopeptide (TPR) repeat protein
VAWSNLGMTLTDLGLFDESVTALRRSSELNPNFTTSFNWLSDALIQKGEPKQALEVVEQALRRLPDSPMLLTAWGKALRKIGRTDEAFTAYEQALAKEPNWYFAQEQLAEILAEKGEKKKALALLDKAQQTQPSYLGLYVTRWKVHHLQGDYDDAIKAAEAAVQCKPQSDTAHHILATALYLKQKYPEAAAEYRIATKLAPSNAIALYYLGSALIEHKLFDEALEAFEAAVHWNADQALFHNGVGEGLMHQKRYTEATLAFKKAAALQPNSSDTHSHLSWAYYRAGYHAEAEREAAIAIKLDSKNAVACNAMGNALYGQGRFAEAVKYYRKAQEITPKDAMIQLNLGRSLFHDGDFTEGHKWLSMSVQNLKPEHPNRELADKELKDCQRAMALDKQIQAFKNRGELPKASKDVFEMADIARRYQQHHHTAVALYARIFTPEADLTDELIGDHRYRAACSAVLTVAGKARDLPKPAAVKQGQLRGEALGWLRAELDRATKLSEAGKSEDAPRLIDRIARWKIDKDLEGVRDPKKLPESEQPGWRELWADAELFVKVGRAGILQVTLTGSLTSAVRSQTHELRLIGGKTYLFELECREFDPLLLLKDSADHPLAKHEDTSPGDRIARLVFTAPADGLYRLIVTSPREAGIGAYSLRIGAVRDGK